MNEFMKENEVIGEVRAPLEHAAPNTEEKAEIKKETTPVNRIEKLLERRDLLKEKHAKSIENEKSAANRTKVIEAQMAKVDKEIHADEISRMDRFCAERNFTYDDIMDILGVFPQEVTAADIKAMYK
jgi:hypothetical protein